MGQVGKGLGDQWPPSACCPPLGGTGSPAMVSLSLSPGTAWAAPAPLQEQSTEGRRSIPFPLGAECQLGAGVTQCLSPQERAIPTCPVLHTLTWPLQESLQGVCLPWHWCPQKPGGSQSLACARARATLVSATPVALPCSSPPGCHCTPGSCWVSLHPQGPAGSWGVTGRSCSAGSWCVLMGHHTPPALPCWVSAIFCWHVGSHTLVLPC